MKNNIDFEKLFQLINEKEKLEVEYSYTLDLFHHKSKVLFFEKILNTIPIKLDFSMKISDKLNKHQKSFTPDQLNKLTRFLTHIESEEKEYCSLYTSLEKDYLNNPNQDLTIKIIVLFDTIIKFYIMFLSILKNVKKDVIVFNKIYNLLEDEGFFMTKSENEKLDFLRNISFYLNEIGKNTSGLNKIDNMIELLGIEKNNIDLSSIEDSLLNIEVSLESIKSDVFSLI